MSWQRLDGRVVAVDATRVAGALVPLAVAVALRNADASAVASTLTTVAVFAAAAAVLDLWRWSTTRYRITDTRVEIRTGLLTRRHVSVPRDRIRRVDATAKVLHRVYGLAVVVIATGEQSDRSGDEVKLDAVAAERAGELRRQLLGGSRPIAPASHRDSAPAAAPTTDAGTAAPPPHPIHRTTAPTDPPATDTGAAAPPPHPTDGTAASVAAPGADAGWTLASLRWSWAPYAVLSVWTLIVPAVVVGGALQALSSVGVAVEEVADDDRIADTARSLSPATALALVAGVGVVVGVVGALARFVAIWWGFHLVHEPGGRLRIRRGLLTTRTISLDESRLRGVELTEPLLLRAAGGARLEAVTTGAGGSDAGLGERVATLMPAAPVDASRRVAAAVLAEDRSPIEPGDLRAHPAAARRRRVVRAGAVTVVALAAAAAVSAGAAGGEPGPSATLGAWATAAAVSTVVVTYALASYRSLGHALDGRYLVVRRGALVRRTVALRRAGVIGWTVRSTPFQRRLGLATVIATTAAGAGAYALVDVDARGLAVAADTVPGLLDPFLVGSPGREGDVSVPTARPGP